MSTLYLAIGETAMVLTYNGWRISIVPSLYVCLVSKIVEDERLLVMGTKLDGLERFARDGES